MPSIQLNKVSFAYPRGPLVLREVSVEFPAREITAIVGMSGSGKSTLLQLIPGLLLPSSGDVRVDGESLAPASLTTIRRRIGYVVQGVGLFPHLSVEQNIAIMRRILPREWDFAAIDELLTMMNIPLSYKTRFPRTLSGGEIQRVGICRALYHSPDILLLDESLGALDVLTRRDIQLELLNYHKLRRPTILFVTHDIREAFRIADNILVIHRGAVQQFGTRREVFASPANAFVESLLTDTDLTRLITRTE